MVSGIGNTDTGAEISGDATARESFGDIGLVMPELILNHSSIEIMLLRKSDPFFAITSSAMETTLVALPFGTAISLNLLTLLSHWAKTLSCCLKDQSVPFSGPIEAG